MKICFVLDSIYNLGGAQRCTVMIANELVKKNYDVTIICTQSISSTKKNNYGLSDNVKILQVKMNNKIQKILSIWSKFFIYLNNNTNLFKNNASLLEKIYYRKYKNGFKEIEKILNEEKYDVIIGVSSFFSIFITLLNINYPCKLIGWQHSNSERYFNLKGEFLWHQDALVKKALAKLQKYIVLTNVDREYILKNFKYDSTVINNPLSFEIDKISNMNNKNIISVGRYNNVKGFDLLIQAFSDVAKVHPEWKLKIVGDGKEEKNLKNLVKSLNLEENVYITGKSKNIINDYLNSEIYILSSRAEGMPLVVLEAMECGLPIVSFDLPCIHEIITDKNGFAVEYLNIEELSSKINFLIENEKLRKEMGKASKKTAKNFSMNIIIKKWEMVLNETNNTKIKKNIK